MRLLCTLPLTLKSYYSKVGNTDRELNKALENHLSNFQTPAFSKDKDGLFTDIKIIEISKIKKRNYKQLDQVDITFETEFNHPGKKLDIDFFIKHRWRGTDMYEYGTFRNGKVKVL